jgi:arabinogalactan endo-1,4-beta-galactosidase
VAQELTRPGAAPPLVNPGFEAGLAGWRSAGRLDAAAHSGSSALWHDAGRRETTQTLTGLPNGWHTLKAWVRSSGDPVDAYIALKDCGGEAARAAVPRVPGRWLRIVVSAEVTDQQCTVSLGSEAEGEAWVSFDDVELVPGRAALPIRGADISSLKKSEDHGGVYYDAAGAPADALRVLRDHGLNYARHRVWVASPDGYHGLAQLLAMARRYQAIGLRLLVDFHYADSWADPGKQPKPRAWTGLDFEGLKRAVYDHTFEVCSRLKAQGTPPDMVQIGNEITNGMLWPDGSNDQGFDNLAALLTAGGRAVKACSPETRVMLHLDNGGNNDLYRRWFDSVIAQGVAFDLIGASYYPYWHGTLADLQNNLDDVARRYGRDIVLVETAYAFTPDDQDDCENVIRSQESPGYPFTPAGQARMLADVMTLVRAVPDGRGLGVMWWDATWTAVPGNGWDPAQPAIGNNWENQALFDFDSRPLPALRCLGRP